MTQHILQLRRRLEEKGFGQLTPVPSMDTLPLVERILYIEHLPRATQFLTDHTIVLFSKIVIKWVTYGVFVPPKYHYKSTNLRGI